MSEVPVPPVAATGELPQQPGTTSDVVAAAPVTSAQSSVSAATTLAELASEYVFFTHALFFAYGLMSADKDPLTHYVNTVRPGLVPLVLDLGRPLFQQFPAYNSNLKLLVGRLFGCPKPEWPALHKYLSGVAGVHRDMQLFWRAGAQTLPIVDFLATARLVVLPISGLPTVDVTVYAVGRSDATFGVVPTPDGCLRVVREMPLPEIVAAGNALLTSDNVQHAVD